MAAFYFKRFFFLSGIFKRSGIGSSGLCSVRVHIFLMLYACMHAATPGPYLILGYSKGKLKSRQVNSYGMECIYSTFSVPILLL